MSLLLGSSINLFSPFSSLFFFFFFDGRRSISLSPLSVLSLSGLVGGRGAFHYVDLFCSWRLFQKYKWFSFSGTFAKPGQITRRDFTSRKKIYCAQLLQTLCSTSYPNCLVIQKTKYFLGKTNCFVFVLPSSRKTEWFFECLGKAFSDVFKWNESKVNQERHFHDRHNHSENT